MRASGSRIGRIALPLRLLAQRFALAILIGASVVLLIMAKGGSTSLADVRAAVLDIATPVFDVISRPVAAINTAADEIVSIALVYQENERLKQENERLQGWQANARKLEQENAAMRALVHARPDPGVSYVSGRVIADSGGPFVRTVIINAGEGDGVRKGEAAVSGDGLVGRVVELGARSARILLLTDLNSRVPVIVESSRYRAILEGDNSETMKLTFVTPSDEVRVGDRIFTSGSGGLFPAGLPIGVVTSIDKSGAAVTPFVRFDRLEYLRVLRYDFPGIDAAPAPAAKK